MDNVWVFLIFPSCSITKFRRVGVRFEQLPWLLPTALSCLYGCQPHVDGLAVFYLYESPRRYGAVATTAVYGSKRVVREL